MDNLILCKKQKFCLNGFHAGYDNSIFINGKLYCFVGSEVEYRPTVSEHVEQVVMPPGLGNDIVSISFIRSWNCIFIATVANLTTYTIGSRHFTTTPYLQSNYPIVQTDWNPNQSVLIVIDAAGIISGYSYKPLLEFADDHQFSRFVSGSLDDIVPRSVYVGWGARNTQFRGSIKPDPPREGKMSTLALLTDSRTTCIRFSVTAVPKPANYFLEG